jgi:hypothetical protein
LIKLKLINNLPRRQSKEAKAAEDRVNCIQLILMIFSFEGICTDIHDGLFELQPQLIILPDGSRYEYMLYILGGEK